MRSNSKDTDMFTVVLRRADSTVPVLFGMYTTSLATASAERALRNITTASI